MIRSLGDVPRVALTIRQPWAWLILHGGKSIENRSWPTLFRGAFLVHAAKNMTRAEYDGALRVASELAPELRVPPATELVRGGFVGTARVRGVVNPCVASDASCACGRAWHEGNAYGFELVDVAPTPFVPFRGMLGFFRVPDDVRAQLVSP